MKLHSGGLNVRGCWTYVNRAHGRVGAQAHNLVLRMRLCAYAPMRLWNLARHSSGRAPTANARSKAARGAFFSEFSP